MQAGGLDLAAILRKKTLHDEQEGEFAPLYNPEASSPQTAQSMSVTKIRTLITKQD